MMAKGLKKISGRAAIANVGAFGVLGRGFSENPASVRPIVMNSTGRAPTVSDVGPPVTIRIIGVRVGSSRAQ